MDRFLFGVFQILIVSFAIIQNGFGHDFLMKIVPDKINGLTPVSNLTLSCWSAHTFPLDKEILLMEIAKDDDIPIAILRHDNNVTLQTENRTHFYAEGSIYQGSSKNFLRLTIVNPQVTDAGTYSCIVYINDNGVLREKKLSADLKVDNGNGDVLEYLKTKLTSLEQRLQTSEEVINEQNNTITELKEKIKTHDSKLNNQDTKLNEQVTKINEQDLKLQEQDVRLSDQKGDLVQFNHTKDRIEKDIKEHERILKSHATKINWEMSKLSSNSDRIQRFEGITRNLTEMTTYSNAGETQAIAFTAYYDAKDKFDEGDTIVFSKVQLNEGNGYDEKSGVFKASRPGLYVFHLSIATSKSYALKNVEIVVNDKPQAKLFAYDADLYGEQSSISCTVKLLKGDMAKVVAVHRSHNSNRLNKDSYYSVFTGFLLKELK